MKKTWLLLTSLILAGCGGEDNPLPEPTPSPSPIPSMSQAPSIIANTTIGETKHIPIYQSIQAKSGQLLSISSVRQLNNESTAEYCPEPKINGLELIYTQDSMGICSYEYTVTDNTTDASTTARLISSASLDDSTKLADIASSTVMGTIKTIDIPVTDGDTLNVVTVLGAGSAVANSNSIVFTPSQAGLARVVYTVENNSGATPVSKIGVVNVTVSELADDNTLPVTPNESFFALPGETKVFTLGITDTDVEDNPQLISVISSDAVTVAPNTTNVDADYFTNKTFSFTAALPGSYTVFYTAHDHRGGYNTGRATVSVAGDVGLVARDASFFRKPSNNAYDFKIDLRSYISATDITKVDYVSAVFDDATSSTIDKNPAHIIAPTKATPVLTYKYPGGNKTGLVAIKYTVKNSSGQTSGRVFINIGSTRPIITTVGTTTDVDYGATVTATSTCTNCVEAKTEYTWTYAGNTDKGNTFKVPDGVAGESIILEATPYGTKGERGVSKSITYNYPLITMTSSIIKNNAAADNVDTNIVKFKVIKADGKGLGGKNVSATVDKSSASLVADTKVTDGNGEVQFDIKSSAWGEVEVSGLAVSTGGVETRAAAGVSFRVRAAYCHQFDVPYTDMNCLPYIIDNDGKMWTAGLSQVFQKSSYPDLEIARYAEQSEIKPTDGQPGLYASTTHEQSVLVCEAFNTLGQYGRRNWRLPEVGEMDRFSNDHSPYSYVSGWPVTRYYWAASDRTDGGWAYDYASDRRRFMDLTNDYFAGCVSNPNPVGLIL